MERGYEERSYGESSYYVGRYSASYICWGCNSFPFVKTEIDLKFGNLLKTEEKVLQSIVWEIEGRIIYLYPIGCFSRTQENIVVSLSGGFQKEFFTALCRFSVVVCVFFVLLCTEC
jgi:hypothetical protein